MSDPRETLARIRAQADAATDGPWTWATHSTADGDEWAVFSPTDWALATNRDGWGGDAEFIAAARTTVPALVDALEAVLKVHRPMHCEPECCTEPVYCEGCKQPDDAPDWPCPTVKAITDALDTHH